MRREVRGFTDPPGQRNLPRMDQVLQRLDEELGLAVRGLSAQETQWTPMLAPEKWTIQQIVEHLLLSYRSSWLVFQKRIDKAAPTQAKPSLRQRMAQAMIGMGYFPRGRQAPAEVSPEPSEIHRPGDELARKIEEELTRLDAAASEAERLFGKRQFATHFVLGPLSARQWRRFHLVHGLHHVKQIRQIRLEHNI